MTNDADRTPPAPLSTPGTAEHRPVTPDPTTHKGTEPATHKGTADTTGHGTDRSRTSPDIPAPRVTTPPRSAAAPARPAAETSSDDRTGTPASAPKQSGRTDTASDDGLDRLLPAGDHDKFALRLQQAVTDFVESPRRAVEEAESTFEAVVEGLTNALDEHRRTLRTTAGKDADPGSQTEELRITLQHYRDITERLLKV